MAPLFESKPAARNRPEPVAADKNRLQPCTATTLVVGWFKGIFLYRFLPIYRTDARCSSLSPRPSPSATHRRELRVSGQHTYSEQTFAKGQRKMAGRRKRISIARSRLRQTQAWQLASFFVLSTTPAPPENGSEVGGGGAKVRFKPARTTDFTGPEKGSVDRKRTTD